jgi:hypothetical protein
MKWTIFTVILFVIPYFAFAQFSAGIKTTIPFFNANRAFGAINIDNTTLSEVGFFPVINLGGFMHYSFDNPLALQVEIKYTYEGLYYNVDKVEDDWPNVFSLGFIEVPLLVQGKWGNKFRWFAQTGLSLKFLLSSESFPNDPENDTEKALIYHSTNAIEHNLKKIVLKANVGTGFMLDLLKYFMFIGEMRFGYDITPIINDVRFLKLEVTIGVSYKFK